MVLLAFFGTERCCFWIKFYVCIYIYIFCYQSQIFLFSFPFLEVIPTDKEEVAFKDLDIAILVGSMPRREGMERKDLLKANVKIFKSQGAALDKYAKKTVKVNIEIEF